MAKYDDRIWRTGKDQRDPYQRDRDRILYSSAFRRLAGVTQVVSPSEGHIFHNRLTHSLEVAQIARRLAERLRRGFSSASRSLGGVNADVAEAAALAHDLGHPPFGHVAEKELDRLVRTVGCLDDGYEGNAQSFRIVTKLCVRKNWPEFEKKNKPGTGKAKKPRIEAKRGDYGLNLTRATLNAVLKYPWCWGPDGKPQRKWGVYDTEVDVFEWAREMGPEEGNQCIEAAVMDWADDIAYSIHDTEDFYRAGLIPLDRLSLYEDERNSFLEAVFKRWKMERRILSDETRKSLEDAFHEFGRELPITEPYRGTPQQRMTLRAFTASKIGELITETTLRARPSEPLDIPPRLKNQVEIVKQLVWQYVILNPSLATQQRGYVCIIQKLFETYLDAANRGPSNWTIIPARYRQVLEDWREEAGADMPKARLVRNIADAVSGLSDSEAISAYKRLTGISSGSIVDLLPS